MQIRLLLSASSIIAIPAVLFAAEVWQQQKPPSDWSEKDCSKVVAKSPWAKDTQVSMGGMGGGTMGDGRGAGRGGGGGGGGMGGGAGRSKNPGDDNGPGATQMPDLPHVVIRWDSAMPVREAMKKVSVTKSIDEEDAKAFYIVTIDGYRRMGRGGQPAERIPPTPRRQLAPEEQDRYKAVTNLTVKGKDPIQPAKIDALSGDDGKMTVHFYFPRSTELSLDDKEVTFQTRMGPMEVKQKFTLKDMTYDGKLTL